MNDLAADRIGVDRAGLIAFVGAGGKSTLMFRLAGELVGRGTNVVVTTTTRMGIDQVPDGAVLCDPGPDEVTAALARSPLVMAVRRSDPHKVTGPSREAAARLLTATPADHLLVEADGSRGLPLKAPAAHEPVIPPETTLVVVCAGLDAVGRTFEAACHRPELGAALAGREPADLIRPVDVAAVVGHPGGGLAGAPPGTRVVVALTKTPPDSPEAAAVVAALAPNDRIDRVVVFGITARGDDRPGRSTPR